MKKNKFPREIKKILVIRNDKIGDLVISSGIIPLLRESFPKSQIDIIVSNENKSLIEENPSINKIYVLNYCPRKIKDFLNYLKLSKKIREQKYDLGFAVRGSFFNVLLLLSLGRVKYKIGFYTNLLTKFLLDFSYLKDFKGHASSNILDMVNKSLGKDFKKIWPEIVTSKDDLSKLNQFLKKNNVKNSISLCIDASNREKQWPLERFDEIIRYLKEKYPKYKIFLVGIDQEKGDFLMKRNPSCIPFFNKNLRSAFLLFKKNDLVIAPDGGMMHLAWAAKTDLIAFIPPTIVLEDIRPLGEKSKFFYKDLEKITVEEVKESIDKKLKK